ncbi:MAG: helix-turn-helix transcriptional regulator [Blautia sp.]|nr:helix-turn-helix transcriptional regulator [Blautia sp.]
MEYRIRESRERAGMSQEQLSKKSGVSRAIISGLENGSITVTTTKTLSRIAEALGLKVSEIFLS